MRTIMKKKLVKSVTTDAVKENEFLAYLCLSENDVKKLQKLVKNGLSVTSFMLTLMDHFGCSKEDIKATLEVAVNVNENIFYWVKNFFDADTARVIIQKFEDKVPEKFTKSDCVKFGLWQTLLNRKKYEELAENAPDFLLAKEPDNRWAMEALLGVNFDKYVGLAYDKGMYFSIFCRNDGWKYLVDNNKLNYVFDYLKNDIVKKSMPLDHILEYIYSKGCVAELYDAGYYDLLLEKREFEVFINKHSINAKFLTQYPELVDWEDLWNYYSGQSGYLSRIKELARKNNRNKKCHEFLLNHSTFWERLFKV